MQLSLPDSSLTVVTGVTKTLDVSFHFCLLSKKNHRRILATKNGMILSASIQSSFQINQEIMNRVSSNKYQPRNLKFRLILSRNPRNSQQYYSSILPQKQEKSAMPGANWKNWLFLITQIKLFFFHEI